MYKKVEKMRWCQYHVIMEHKHLLLTIILFVGYFNKTNAECSGLTTTAGWTEPPGDIIIREGNNLDIFCILNKSYVSVPGNFNASHLVFYRDSEKIPTEMVKVINVTTAHLHIENLPRSSSQYYCKFTNNKGVCMNKVAVDTIPFKAENFSCLSINWENLTCTWRAPEQYVENKYNLTFTLNGGRAARNLKYGCPNYTVQKYDKDVYGCFWNISTSPHYRQVHQYYTFTLKTTNVFGSINQIFEFNHFAHVKPAAATNFTSSHREPHSVTLSWNVNKSLMHFRSPLIYQIMYQSVYDTDWKTIQFSSKILNKSANENVHTYVLSNLTYAHTLYDVRIRSRSEESVSVWSDNASHTFHTLATIPDRPPRTDYGSFLIVDGSRDVYIYWQMLNVYEFNGLNFTYVVYVKKNGQRLQNNSTVAYVRIPNLGDEAYEFHVYSVNQIGHSVNKSVVRVPSKADSIPVPNSFTKIAYNIWTYELSWKPPETSQEIVNYTIFWCLSKMEYPFKCEGHLYWTHVPGTDRMWNKTFDKHWNGTFQFAISANTHNSSSGMVWASCTILEGQFEGKINDVWIKEVGSTHIVISWALYCSNRVGIVTGYRIYYCPIKNAYFPECIEPKSNITVDGDANNANVTNLRPYTTYQLKVAVITASGEGPPSENKYNTTYETAPDIPQNLTIVSITNTSLTFKWNEPKSMNGVLRYYLITILSEINNIVNRTEHKWEKGHPLQYTANGLHSYTIYNINVAACTYICSVSATMNATTKIGVPGTLSTPVSREMNDSHTLYEWSPPSIIGGNVIYQIQRERIQDKKRVLSFYNTSGNHHSVDTACESEGDSTSPIVFKISVRAITEDENHETLIGPWSNSAQKACSNISSSTYYIYIIIFLIAIIGFLGFIGKRTCVKCKAMRDVQIKLPAGLASSGGSDSNHWSTQGTIVPHTPLKSVKERPSLDTVHVKNDTIAADEQLLLERSGKRSNEFDNENDSNGVNNRSDSNSVLVNEDSITSSTPITSSSSINNRNLSLGDNDVPEKDSCSLRLRNVPPKSMNESPIVDQNKSKGYVTLPEKIGSNIGSSGGGPWSKAMQLKNLDGYSQLGAGGKPITLKKPLQSLPPTTTTSGYVPHPQMLSNVGVVPKPVVGLTLTKATPPSGNYILASAPAIDAIKLPEFNSEIENSKSNNKHYVQQDISDINNQLENCNKDNNDEDKNIEEEENADDEEVEDNFEDDVIEDNFRNVEMCSSDAYDILETSLVDLDLLSPVTSLDSMPTISTDDLINISDTLELYNMEVTKTPPSYVSLAAAKNINSPQIYMESIPKAETSSGSTDMSTSTLAATTSNTGIPTNIPSKPTTPNPYSRVGIWDNPIVNQQKSISENAVVRSNSPLSQQQTSTSASVKWKPISLDNKEIKTSQLITNPVTSTPTKSSYVPINRQFPDCKLLKED